MNRRIDESHKMLGLSGICRSKMGTTCIITMRNHLKHLCRTGLNVNRALQTGNTHSSTSMSLDSKCSERKLLDLTGTSLPLRHFASQQETIMNVFDRQAKRLQKNRTARLSDYKVYEYIRDEVGWRVADRICDVKRKFEVAADIGCWRGHVSKNIYSDMVGTLYQLEMAEDVLAQSEVSPEVPTIKIHGDEEALPFEPSSLDLAVSSLSLHWVNDLPGTFKQIHTALKKDGCFIGAMFGGDTLFELRCSLQLAEEELEGGFGVHISPFTRVQDLGGLLNRTGYTMLTIDIDEIVVNYPSIFEVMRDLKGMGENNASWSRKTTLHRKTQKRAAEIYMDMYGDKEKGCVPATFQIINFIAWKPDPSQAKPAERGSGQVSMKDIGHLEKLSQQMSGLREETEKGDHTEMWKGSLDSLTEDIDKLRRRTIEQDDDQDGSNKK